MEAMEKKTSGARYLRFGPEFLLFRKGYGLCLHLLHHLGDVKPNDDVDRAQRDLACDTLDSLRVAETSLLGGYENQALLLLRRAYESTTLMAYFINFPSAVKDWDAKKRISPSEIREALETARVREPKDQLATMYKVYSLFAHVNRETVWNRLLGEANRFTVGAQDNVADSVVGGVVRELLRVMMWFVDVMNYAFMHVVGKRLSEEYKTSVLSYRDEVEGLAKHLPMLF